MKKILLGALLTLGYTFGANAQVTITATNFPNNVIPATWTQQLGVSIPTNKGWVFGNTVPGTLANYMPPSGNGYFAYVDDIDNNPGSPNSKLNNDTLYTGVLNCSAYTSVFISFDIFYQGYYLTQNNNDKETASVACSIDGGKTWTTAITNPYGDWTTLTYDISSFVAGHANVKVAFTYTDDGAQLVGMGLDNVKIYSPAPYDVAVLSQNLPSLMQVGKPYTFSGVAGDSGSNAITSMNMNYYVNSPSNTKSQTISGISGFNPLTTYNWTMSSVPFTPATPGVYTVKYWANKLNGSNPNVNTDTLVAKFWAIDSVKPRMVMFEETSNASCNPCMFAMPNIDSVCDNTVAYCNTIRYHWYFPGQDMINLETPTLVNDRFVTYYGQNGVPSGSLDGKVVPPSPNQGAPYFSSAMVQADAAVGSPFTITINKLTYTAATKTYSLTATIKAFADFPAGLKAQVALTEDSVDFKTDQSTEDPPSVFIMNGGNVPNSYYDLVLNFPNAVEAMLPTDQGTSLAAFTTGSTQTINVSWVKNHPWAAKYKSYPYDSSTTQHLTVFIQDDAGNPGAGIPAKYVYQSARAGISSSALGVEEISNGVPFKMYPNPSNSNTTLAFNLDQDQNVNVKVYNMLGEVVYSNNEGRLSSGQHTIMINGSALDNGVYLVNLTTDSGLTVQRLVIQK